MKKKSGFFAVVALAVAMFVGARTHGQSGSTQLSDLLSFNSANAECTPYNGIIGVGGACFGFGQYGQCIYDGEHEDCFAGY
jgi:hypothetical protein